jgi:hypothetical protein
VTEQAFLDFADHYCAFLKAEISHVKRELDELRDFQEGKRVSDKPLGSVFYANVGHRLAGLLMEMEYWGKTH